jgi:hypothetical protein
MMNSAESNIHPTVTTHEDPNDKLCQELQTAILHDPQMASPAGIAVSIKESLITKKKVIQLFGHVPTKLEKKRAFEIVDAKTDNEYKIVNRLVVSKEAPLP